MLKIKKDGLLYKFAYGHWFGPNSPFDLVHEACNLCQLGRHLLFAPLWWGLTLVSFVAFHVIFRFLAFLFGRRPNPNVRTSNHEDLCVPIERIPQIRGRRIVPIVWLIVACVLWWGGSWLLTRLSDAPSLIQAIGSGLRWLLWQALIVLVYMILIVLAVALYFFIKKQLGELWAVISGLAKAAKQKVCPFVEFVETEVSNEQIPT